MRARFPWIVFCVSVLVSGCGADAARGSSTPTAPTVNPPSAPSPPLDAASGCQTISKSGSYVLERDIGQPGTANSICLTVIANDVTFDCARHSINGYISIATGASQISVLNCTMSGITKSTDVSNVTVSNSLMSDKIVAMNSQGVTLDHDQITLTGRSLTALVILEGGSRNQVISNRLDGGYYGHDLTGHGDDAPGADDGILLSDETDDVVRDNTIQNVFDAGIEGVNAVSTTMISNNSISNAIMAGVSSYWCTDWETNTVSENRVSESLSAVTITYATQPSCDQVPASARRFAGNNILDNSLRAPLGEHPIGILISLASSGLAVSSNVVRGNDVGSAAILLSPILGFSSSGGNTCGAGGNVTC